MRFLFLNQYFPPDPAPTGVLLAELAAELTEAGHTVDFIAARQDYRGAQQQGGRMRREAVALLRMLGDGVRQERADVVISASSPPSSRGGIARDRSTGSWTSTPRSPSRWAKCARDFSPARSAR